MAKIIAQIPVQMFVYMIAWGYETIGELLCV